MTNEDKRAMRRFNAKMSRTTSAGLLAKCGEVRKSIAYSRKRWPDYEIPKHVFRWWDEARRARISEGSRLP